MTKEDRSLFLVNLGQDIGETRNFSAQDPEVVERMLGLRGDYEKSIAESP